MVTHPSARNRSAIIEPTDPVPTTTAVDPRIVVGSTGAIVLTWILTKEVFEIDWVLTPAINVGGVVVTTVVVTFVGVVSSVDVLRRKPLGTLRAE